MANNIKIVGNILSTTTVSRYSEEDIKLIQSSKLQKNFGGKNDYIEYFIYDAGGNLLNINFNYLSYKIPSSTGLIPGTTTTPNTTGNIQTENVGVTSTLSPTTSSLYPIIEIDPVQDLQNQGYSSGEFKVQYNFFQNKISDYSNEALFIKEISQDRTEIRLASLTLSDDEIENLTLDLIDQSTNSTYYIDYLLNFGNNEQYVAVNIALNKASTGYEVLFKLYEPLPLSVKEKMTLWVVEEIVNPYVFDINLDKFIIPLPAGNLRGPNFDVTIPNQSTVSSTYNTYSNLITGLQSLQSSSYRQILNLLATQSIDINVDYTDFNNFIFFGSAYQRVTNFYTKAKQIEDYRNLINKYTPYVATTASLQFEINRYSSSIETIISQFDGYESYLYFESSSYTWPKTSSTKPFSLLSTGSAITKTWYNTLTGSSQTYDLNNYDNLEYSIPSYVKNNTDNYPFLLFLNMVGQYFDNIWIYLKAVTDVNLANNNLDYGISRDLVYERLKSLGLHLYNTQAGESVAQYLIGSNTGSSIFPFTPTSGNDFTITGSFLNNIPRKDLVSELYKRIYHNLPLLLKTKGTVAGLDYLMTTFGIPNQTYYTVISGSISESFYTPTGSNSTGSILSVNEFGGSLKSNLIKGYNNDKVRIVSNTIVPGPSGSILSPLLSLQSFPTSSSSFRDDDMNYVDISFSPQNQIDTYISGAIASNNPTWSLDDYIGDPRQQYSSSYPDLDTQRKLYFETGVSGFRPFTGSLMDYNGFIRLIQYFDNALFKMLEDFTPERTSLSTGVTFNSPVLERNKAVYANPSNSTTQSVYDAEYSASTISSTYGNFYNALSSSNNTMGWYDGELSGSKVNIYQYFTDNYNPYLGNWNVWNSQYPSQSIDANSFAHSDWNVLLNNVSKSIVSTKRKKIEYIWGTTGSLISSVELQDSYLTLRSYNTSRYEGSTVSSLKYNTYTGSINSLVPAPINTSTDLWYTLTNINGILAPWVGIIPTNGNGLILSASFASAIKNKTPLTITYISGDSIGSNNGTTVKATDYFTSNPGNPNASFYISFNSISQNITPTVSPVVRFDGLSEMKMTYSGDNSFGKTAAIDRNTVKIGWVKTIPSQSLNFYDKTQIQLKYLVDKNSNLTELSRYNYNLFEVQNTFKSGDSVDISLDNVTKPSFQRNLDGTKLIYRGGVSFDPLFFRENGEIMDFRYTTEYKLVNSYVGYKSFDLECYTYINFINYGRTGYLGQGTAFNPDSTGPAPTANPWQEPPNTSNVSINTANSITYGTGRYVWFKGSYNNYTSLVIANTQIPNLPDTPMAVNEYFTTGSSVSEWKYDINGGLDYPHLSCRMPKGGYTNQLETAPWKWDLASVVDSGYLQVLSSLFYTKDRRKVYAFDLLNFSSTADGGYNTDNGSSFTGTNIYKIPRVGQYRIKGTIPFFIEWKYGNRVSVNQTTNGPDISQPYEYGANFKFFGIVESATSDTAADGDWKYVASTRITDTIYEASSGQFRNADPTKYIEVNQIAVDKKTNCWHPGIDADATPPTSGAPRNTGITSKACYLLKICDDNDPTLNGDNGVLYKTTRPNTYIRFKFYFMDISGAIRWAQSTSPLNGLDSTNTFRWKMRIGKPPIDPNTNLAADAANTIDIGPAIANVPDASFEIFDINQIKVNFDYSAPYTSSKIFTHITTGSIYNNNTLTFDPGFQYLFTTESIFTPADGYSSTYKNYSEISDPSQILPGDLLRIGSFNSPESFYQTVLASEQSFDSVYNKITISSSLYQGSGLASGNPFSYTNKVIKMPLTNESTAFLKNLEDGQFFTISGSNTTNNSKVYKLTGSYQTFNEYYLIPISASSTISAQGSSLSANPWSGSVITFEYLPTDKIQTTILTLTPPDINASGSIFGSLAVPADQNFAFLRPKPNETSVIVNYKKTPGDVSQAILIPQDLKTDVKDQIGNISKALSVSNINSSTSNG